MTCKHDNVVFNGMYSLVGNYLCKDCNIEIDPVEYAKMKGKLNIALLDYYEENLSGNLCPAGLFYYHGLLFGMAGSQWL